MIRHEPLSAVLWKVVFWRTDDFNKPLSVVFVKIVF